MRVHLPALIALVSTTAYLACGSSDGSKAVPEGGAGGEGGMAPSSGGKNSSAGSQSSGGSQNSAGEAGMNTGGVPANAGAAGAGGAAGAAGAGLGGESAAGGMNSAGASGAPADTMSLPAACPGPLGSYVTLVGTDGDDHFMAADVSGQKLIFGLDGTDTFDGEHGGNDCLVGGPGDDDFTNSDEFANYYVGGPGADTYHISTTGNFLRIADMEPDDELSFKQTTFTFLTGAAGDSVNVGQLHLAPGYSLGAPSGAIEGSSLVFDSSEGELWLDVDGGVKGANDKLILTILNHDDYNFDPDDFVIE